MSQLSGLTFGGIVLGAAMGAVYAYFQAIPAGKPIFWWATSLGSTMFTVGLASRERLWRVVVFVVALLFIGVEFLLVPNLFTLFRKADPGVYDHTLLGMGLGALFGLVLGFKR